MNERDEQPQMDWDANGSALQLDTIMEDGNTPVPKQHSGRSKTDPWSHVMGTSNRMMTGKPGDSVLGVVDIPESDVADFANGATTTTRPESHTAVERKKAIPIWGIVLTVVFVIIVLAVGVVFFIIRDDDDADSTPSPSVVTSIQSNTRDTDIRNVILSITNELENGGGLHEKATEWIINEDEAQLSLDGVDSVSEDRIIQRYVSALFCYSVGLSDDSSTNAFSVLHECNWTGFECDWTTTEPSIKKIDMSGSGLIGTIPTEIGLLSNLTKLDLQMNSLNGTIPDTLVELNDFRYLDLFGNMLSGSIPTFPSTMYRVYLSQNQLTGSLPEDLFDTTSPRLKDYRAHSNNLSGNIPESIGNLQRAKVLIFYNNRLTSTIPSSIGSLSDTLNFFDFAGNFLNGTIPSEMYNLTNLGSIYLDDNFLSGTLSDRVGNLVNLQGLWLSGNSFSGTIPESVMNIPSLVSLTFHENFLNGTVPSTFCDGSITWSNLTADCNDGADSFVSCSCCTRCYPL